MDGFCLNDWFRNRRLEMRIDNLFLGEENSESQMSQKNDGWAFRREKNDLIIEWSILSIEQYDIFFVTIWVQHISRLTISKEEEEKTSYFFRLVKKKTEIY